MLEVIDMLFVVDHFKKLKLLVLDFVFLENLVETLSGFVDEGLEVDFGFQVDLLPFQSHDFIEGLQWFLGYFIEEVDVEYFEPYFLSVFEDKLTDVLLEF